MINNEASDLFAGGEFYEDEGWNLPADTCYSPSGLFLNGGKACLNLIAAYLLRAGIKSVLLPSYICPIVPDTLSKSGLKCRYYPVDEQLNSDPEQIACLLQHEEAFYLVNYFGFPPTPSFLKFISSLQTSGLLVIEDNAMSAFPAKTHGDFVFNSLRKFCPHDGGYLQSKFDLHDILPPQQKGPFLRLKLIRTYRNGLRTYLFNGQGDPEALQALYYEAEKAYLAEDRIPGDPQERAAIERLNWPAIFEKRRTNYQTLLSGLKELNFLEPLFPSLPPDAIPIGLPVYVKNDLRDALFEFLGQHSVGTVIHWEALLEHPTLSRNQQAREIASKILTLSIDQYQSTEQLRYLCTVLRKFFNELQ